jgi:hypothetical protein
MSGLTLFDRVLAFLRLHAVVLIAAAIIIGFLQVRSCQQARVRAAEQRVQTEQGKAQTQSARDAIGTQEKANERERQSEELTRSNEREIPNAEGANDRVNPSVNAAGLRALCRRQVYRDTERCRMFRASASGVATGR